MDLTKEFFVKVENKKVWIFNLPVGVVHRQIRLCRASMPKNKIFINQATGKVFVIQTKPLVFGLWVHQGTAVIY